MRRSGKRSALSSVAGILPIALAIGFVLWVLWRRQGSGRPDLVAAPVRSSPDPSARSSPPSGTPEDAPESRARGRIEDLLERARLEDEGAA